MVEIQLAFTSNCSPRWAPKSNPNSMAIPTARAAPVNRMPIALASRSWSLGRKARTTAPAAGRNTASEIADFSQPLIEAPRLSLEPLEPGDRHGEDRHADEQEHRVSLDVARLEV